MNKKYLASVLSWALLCNLAFAPIAYAETSRVILVGSGVENMTEESGLLSVIVNQMGSDTNVLDDRYSGYFAENTAEDGVKALVAAGACSINGFVIPATAEALASDYPDGYTVNESVWLAQADGGYMVDWTTYSSYDDAVMALFRRVPAGVETKLYDENGDGCVDRLNIEYVEAVIVDQIVEQEDGTLCVTRAELPDTIAWSENDGKIYDGTHFTSMSEERISSENFDFSIQEGDLALFALTTDGWSMKRAMQVNDILTAGADHEYYQMDTVQYEDAMRFSRDNLMISNRCGEYLNAHEYFGFLANDRGLKVNLWLVPATDRSRQAAPAGFTSGENAAAFLALAVETAKEKLDAVEVSIAGDGSDVEEGISWTTQASHDELMAAIGRAETVLAGETNSVLCDYQVYLLYLTLHGSADDIGAEFAGFHYSGFDNQIHEGRHRYTFENLCRENHELALGDGTTKIFLNTEGIMNDISNVSIS